jgi:DNA mismatch repair ATPase MutS
MAGILLTSGALALVCRKPFLEALPALRGLGSELGVLAEGLRLLQTQTFHSPLLQELAALAAQSDAASHIRRLKRWIGVFREREEDWFYHVSRALLIGTQFFLAVETWRAVHGATLRRWLAAWGEFEALMAIANYAYEHPHNTFPELKEGGSELQCEALGHPLLASDICVRNNIAWSERTRFYVISGSNMAGKSTLLRAVGLNVVLAYAGAPVCATRMALSRWAVCASIAIQDSLLNGKSKFLAEVERLKQVLKLAPDEQGSALFLIDEVLSGTNSKDRRVAAEVILRALLERGAIGALSTHDLALTELADLPDLPGANVHMGSIDESDPLRFDFLVKPGVTRQSTALAIVRLAGVSI